MEAPGELWLQTSMIVCTVDRWADLDRCLESLQPFRSGAAEILIVHNGPACAAVEEISQRRGARLVVEPRRGAAYARNAGVRAAHGEFLAFLDDDSRAGEDWLPRLLAPFADPTVDCVLGGVRAENPADPVQQAFEQWVWAGAPCGSTLLEAGAACDAFPLRLAMSGLTGSVAFRRDAFQRFGYFDERFGRGTRIGSGEDPDLFFNLLRRGARIFFEPRAQVLHRWPSTRAALRRSVFRAACGHTALLTKYFLEEPTLREEILRYTAARLSRRQKRNSRASPHLKVPRLPFFLGSLYGPLAFLLSKKAQG